MRYGEDGNALALTVHGQCSDPALNDIPLACRTIGHAEAIALSCAWSCASEQHYTYAWDEVNRIAEARRYDRDDAGAWSLAVQQRYLYDSANQRTVKSTTFRDEETVTTRVALYVYPGDFERRGLVVGFGQEGPTYQAIAGDTETQYVVGGARIVWRSDRDGMGIDRDQRITIGLTDLIQSTTAVLDLATGELVETGSYYANGARETYRASSNGDRVAAEPMGFTGKEADEEVGLTYFGQRYLMSHLGRWASPDPLQTHAVGGGEAINGYHYVAGNVLQGRDPVGFQDEPAAEAPAAADAPGVDPHAALVEEAHADERFQALPGDLQRAIEMAIEHDQGPIEDLLRAATFTPGADSGVRVLGPESGRFLGVLRRAMVLSEDFRGHVEAQAASDGTPIIMRVFDNHPGFIDVSEGDGGTGPWGRHIVDMDDVEAFPSMTDPLPYPSATTEEQNVIHFVEEAMFEARGVPFAPAHAMGIAAENRFRAMMGQPGVLQNVTGMSRARFTYRGAPDEHVLLDRAGQVRRIEMREGGGG